VSATPEATTPSGELLSPPGRWRDDRRQILDRSGEDGSERMSAGQWAVGLALGDDERWPCLLEEREALS
jgi:hypothetical protein